MSPKPGDLVRIKSSSHPHNWIPAWDLITKQVMLLAPNSTAVLLALPPVPPGEDHRCQILMQGGLYETYQDYLEVSSEAG